MSRLILVTGGARSGKSSYAEKLIQQKGGSAAYIATCVPFDEELKERVKKHRQMRPASWETYEIYEDIYKKIPEIAKKQDCIILECVTLMVSNMMFKEPLSDQLSQEKIREIESRIKAQWELFIQAVRKTELYVVVVTNEIGMSVIAANQLTRVYTDILGRINQLLAAESDEVYLVISGIPVKIKEQV